MTTDEIAVLAIRDGVKIRQHRWMAGIWREWFGGAFRDQEGICVVNLIIADDWEVYHPEPEPTPEPVYEEWEVIPRQADETSLAIIWCESPHDGRRYAMLGLRERWGYAGLIYTLPDGHKLPPRDDTVLFWSKKLQDWHRVMRDSYTDEIHPSAVRVRKGGE